MIPICQIEITYKSSGSHPGLMIPLPPMMGGIGYSQKAVFDGRGEIQAPYETVQKTGQNGASYKNLPEKVKYYVPGRRRPGRCPGLWHSAPSGQTPIQS